jgi:two-component system, chemotaxis family, protein-glutamate methylesterase/glutaminase
MDRPLHLVIGASGRQGLDDIKAVLAALSHPLDAIVLVVLHRPRDRPSALREILARGLAIPVRVAEQGERLEPNAIYIGEPDQHLTLLGARAELIEEQHRNRTIDLLFKSVAEQAGRLTIGVVLSGSLDDGSRGLAAIHDAGGVTMVVKQERQSPRGMPDNAVDFDGPINVIGSPAFIARCINKLVADPFQRSRDVFERE